jgi:2-dehydro-3-deoxygluconokinase
MALQLLAIGEPMAEIRRDFRGNFSVGFGGDTFNTSVYCARCFGKPGAVGYMSRIGNDVLSNALLDFAKKEALDISHVSRDSKRNIGIYSVSTDSAGERSFSYWRDTSAAREMFKNAKTERLVSNARIIYLSGITLAIITPVARKRLIQFLRKISTSGQSFVAFDSNYRPTLWESQKVARDTISELWEIADIALPSIDDEMALYGDKYEGTVIERFQQKSWTASALKRGVRGPVSLNLPPDSHPEFVQAGTVVDTTAAGDSFNGAFLAAFLDGADMDQCLSAGHALASKVVEFSGAIV